MNIASGGRREIPPSLRSFVFNRDPSVASSIGCWNLAEDSRKDKRNVDFNCVTVFGLKRSEKPFVSARNSRGRPIMRSVKNGFQRICLRFTLPETERVERSEEV